jgi:hypothetical protein
MPLRERRTVVQPVPAGRAGTRPPSVLDRARVHQRSRRNSINAALTKSGASCCSQWPARGTIREADSLGTIWVMPSIISCMPGIARPVSLSPTRYRAVTSTSRPQKPIAIPSCDRDCGSNLIHRESQKCGMLAQTCRGRWVRATQATKVDQSERQGVHRCAAQVRMDWAYSHCGPRRRLMRSNRSCAMSWQRHAQVQFRPNQVRKSNAYRTSSGRSAEKAGSGSS